MEKLYGLVASTLLLALGAYTLISEISAALAAASFLIGIGLTLHFERKIIKETSTNLEKTVSTVLPVITELIILASIAASSSYMTEIAIYLGTILLLTDILHRFEKMHEINHARLLGRISRVIILSLGIAGSQWNSFVLFYGIAAAGLSAVYDIMVVSNDARSSI